MNHKLMHKLLRAQLKLLRVCSSALKSTVQAVGIVRKIWTQKAFRIIPIPLYAEHLHLYTGYIRHLIALYQLIQEMFHFLVSSQHCTVRTRRFLAFSKNQAVIQFGIITESAQLRKSNPGAIFTECSKNASDSRNAKRT